MTTIRNARNYDAQILAELCGQLGYPATRQQIVARLAAIEADPAARVFVAEDAEGRVVGWLHVAQQAHLVDDEVAEVLGLVVAESTRGHGVGAELLRAAETWAHERGAAHLRVRSRIERERAHRFYERAGYQRRKTQHVFAKSFDG
ncbi:GNAT family N-acetyltransferase [Dokdonella sp.]|uniref:GNAT family N-acetyltransferase n=1 Tax=Dokdonella sp. TaxID=2291710 RepID=UPI001B17ACFC|nr:GNAT family N-acetyltransferase [Dokdonella sp.]MBO9663202.1 GNAT family N-acetyltransferase [Dokdonella sp.]